MLDISVTGTKKNGRVVGRPNMKHKKGVLEFPNKLNVLHEIKNLHHATSSLFRKADNYKVTTGHLDV